MVTVTVFDCPDRAGVAALLLLIGSKSVDSGGEVLNLPCALVLSLAPGALRRATQKIASLRRSPTTDHFGLRLKPASASFVHLRDAFLRKDTRSARACATFPRWETAGRYLYEYDTLHYEYHTR